MFKFEGIEEIKHNTKMYSILKLVKNNKFHDRSKIQGKVVIK